MQRHCSRHLVRAAMCAAVASILACAPERYEGKTASEWMEAFDRAPQSAVEERIHAVDALRMLGRHSPNAIAMLGVAARDRSPDVRLAAVTALGLLGSRARIALPTLQEAAQIDSDSTVRAQARRAQDLVQNGTATRRSQ